MNQVSAGTIKLFLRTICDLKNISANDLVQGSPLPQLISMKDNEWLGWDESVDWTEWVNTSFGPIDWKRVGELSFQPQNVPLITAFSRLAFSVRFAYWIAAKWFGPSQFRVISCIFEDLGKNHIRETLVVPASLKHCQAFYEIFIGSLSIFPKMLFNLDAAVVTADIQDRKAVYDIHLPIKRSLIRRFIIAIQNLTPARQFFSELVQQQEEIAHQTAQLYLERSETKNMIANFPDGIILQRQGEIVYVNQMMVSFLNYPNAQMLIGKKTWDIVMPEYREKVMQRNQAIRNDPKMVNPPLELRFQKYGSTEAFDGETSSMSMAYDGKPAILIVTRDLSDRRKFEAHAASMERLTSLGRLAAGVGHEINNPLCYVILKLDMARENLKHHLDASLNKQFDEISYGLGRIQHIVKDLKNLSSGRIEDGLVLVDVGEQLQAAIQMARNEIQHRATLSVDIADLPPVSANDVRLSQVFLNLLMNAAEAIEAGHASENQIHVKAYADADWVYVQIRDTGPGISDEIKANIFKPFFTTKSLGLGTGLGLSISQSIIAHYHGHISVESTLGKGSCFQVALPISGEKNGLLPLATSTAQKTTNLALRGHVVVIDDDEPLLETLVDIVSTEHETTAFKNAIQALEFLKTNPQVDAILCDLMMPNVGGIEFYKLLQEQSPQLCERVLFLTGGSFTEQTDHFLKQPGVHYCQKPIGKNELCEVLQGMMRI